MKNTFPYIITAAALVSFPQFGFCQRTDMITANSEVIGTGIVTFKEGNLLFTGYTSTQVDFDAAMNHVKDPGAVPIVSTTGEHCRIDGQCYGASVDNEVFDVRDHSPFTAALVEQPSSLDGRAPAKTIISIILDGKSYTGHDGNTFDEIVQLELALSDSISPDPKLFSVSLQHNSTVYSMQKGDASNVTISDFAWSTDRKSFTVSLDFNCAMRSWAYASTGKGDVTLKGKMSNIQIKVPGRITASK